MDRNLLQSELERGFVSRVTADDDTSGVHHDRLAKAELADRRRNRLDSVVVEPRIVLVGFDAGDRPEFNFHRSAPSDTWLCWWLRVTECGPGNPGRRAG